MPPLVEARGLTKRFPGVTALREVSFELRAGEIHALCGENGAGKSTLIKLLGGIHPHGTYEGELRVAGEAARFHGVRDAEAAGIAVITQELALVDGLSVAENIFLGRLPTRGARVDWAAMHRRSAELLAEFGLEVSPEAEAGSLGVGARQLIEIIRALDKRSRVLVLDEPTAALTEREVAVLFGHLRRLRERGTACIYISHRLEEIRQIGDRITVLKDGSTVASGLAVDATPTAELITLMTGRSIEYVFPPRSDAATTGEPVLEVEGLALQGVFSDVDLTVRTGEIVGLAGLVGAGRSEILETVYGARRASAGSVRVDGRDRKSTRLNSSHTDISRMPSSA